MEIRTLRAGEREALLGLLDGWELPDGWRGRDFFRRYIEDAPSFRDENVWVAQDAGRLVSCVQIFPRALFIRGEAVPTGGIGSVFTRPEARGRGVARALLERAGQAMRERGFELSLLFAARLAWYAGFGWISWPGTRLLLRRAAAEGASLVGAGPEIDAFDPARDLRAVRAIHARYSGARDGPVVRDTEAWRASLRLAGNPREAFVVARRGGVAMAYARAAVLSGFLVLLELGREAAAADELAQILVRLQTPLTHDPLALASRSSAELRAVAVLSDPHDDALSRALAARGTGVTPIGDPSAMLRVLDADALARRLGVPAPAAEAVEPWLRHWLPPERFVYWPADRF